MVVATAVVAVAEVVVKEEVEVVVIQAGVWGAVLVVYWQ